MASTIETKINRISDNIAATYAAVEEMGGTVPEAANSDNLPEAVRTIPTSGVVVDDTLTISGAAADAKATGDALNRLEKTKLDAPATPPTAAGKVLRVLSVNEDGTFTCEWADAPTGDGETKIKFNKTAQTTDEEGYVNIPYAIGGTVSGASRFGLVSAPGYDWTCYGIYIDSNGYIGLHNKSYDWILSKPHYRNTGNSQNVMPITTRNFAEMLRGYLSDGIDPAWNDTERLSVLLRMGCTVDDNGFVKWTAQEVSE